MNTETCEIYNRWVHQCLYQIIEEAEDKENFTEFLCQGLQDIETQLIEDYWIDEQIAEQNTERIVGILDEILEHPDITDEAIENSDHDVIEIIYDAITA